MYDVDIQISECMDQWMCDCTNGWSIDECVIVQMYVVTRYMYGWMY